MLAEELYEEMDAFLSGILSKEANQQFIKKVEQMPELRTELAFQSDVHLILNAYYKAKLKKKWHEQFLLDQKRNQQTNKNKLTTDVPQNDMKVIYRKRSQSTWKRYLTQLAAVLVVAIGVFGLTHWFNSTAILLPELATQEWNQTHDLEYISNIRSTVNTEEGVGEGKEANEQLVRELVQNAYEKYKIESYADALNVLESIEPTYAYYDLSMLLKGMCYFKLKESPKAINCFQTLIQEGHINQHREEARWYLALSHLQMNQKERAKVLLIEIVNGIESNKGQQAGTEKRKDWNANRAEKLLQKIRNAHD